MELISELQSKFGEDWSDSEDARAIYKLAMQECAELASPSDLIHAIDHGHFRFLDSTEPNPILMSEITLRGNIDAVHVGHNLA
jgi:hypothetical protein